MKRLFTNCSSSEVFPTLHAHRPVTPPQTHVRIAAASPHSPGATHNNNFQVASVRHVPYPRLATPDQHILVALGTLIVTCTHARTQHRPSVIHYAASTQAPLLLGVLKEVQHAPNSILDAARCRTVEAENWLLLSVTLASTAVFVGNFDFIDVTARTVASASSGQYGCVQQE